MKVIFLFLGVALFTLTAFTQKETFFLHQNWRFKQSGTQQYYKATVPGCVHTDLLANQLIPDPFYGTNEKKIQWINTTDWEYTTSFTVPAAMQNQKHLELVFEGLDTYAGIYVNDRLVLQTNNMFRKWKLDVKNLLHKENNTLTVKFRAALNVTDSLAKQNLPLVIPDNNRLYARKAQYQFGWDFAPTFPTCGIWKNVYLQTWQDLKIEQISHQLINRDTNNFQVAIHSGVFADHPMETVIYAKIYEQQALQNGTDIRNKITALQSGLNLQTDKTISFKKVQLQTGYNEIVIPYTIPNPKKWAPNGSGQQPLYKIEVFAGDQYASNTIGLRTIELVTKADSISDFSELRNRNGTGFYFKVNNKPVYIKGANYVPADMFPARVTKAKYRELLVAAKEANMNMLRIWGGGIYEDDYFYDLCDSLGIMVWQDFMFAGAMVPTDTLYAANVKQEAIDQVQRLQHHPSIALWCGNNEIDEAWHNWGWQKQFNLSKEDSGKIWNSYRHVFHNILPEVVKIYHSDSYYWPSSPSIGWGRKESLTQGDSHYWGVWWGLDSIEKYDRKIPRFMSEYGMQSMPSMATIKKFANEKDWDTANALIKNHQKHPTGFQNLKVYLDRLFVQHNTNDKFKTLTKKQKFEYFVYLTQVLQATAYKKAITAHRKNMPYNMGTMLWQLNDPWPVASWSIIDYYGNKKPAYYQVKESYAPVLLTIRKIDDTTINCSAINDSPEDFTSIDFNLMSLDSFQNPDTYKDTVTHIPPYSVKNITVYFDKTIEQKNNRFRYFLSRNLKEKDSIVYYKIEHDKFTPFALFNNLSHDQPKLTPVFNWVKNKLMVTAIKIKKRNTYFEPMEHGFFYHPLIKNIVENNYQYYDIDRGQSEKIMLTRPITENEFLQIKFLCLNY